jgi:predicted acetyltransferase
MPKLVDPAIEWREAFLNFARDWRDSGNDRYDLALDDFDAYLAGVQRSRNPDQIPPGWVPGTEFWLEHEEQIVACVRLRFWLNASMQVEGGHIGYDVRPSARRRGFGTAALRLVLPEAERRGLERVLLTVDADNLPSVKIIERNGGVLSGEVISAKSGKPIRQYWIKTAARLPSAADETPGSRVS